MKPILFSIVTIAYNAEKTIERTLKSVAEQDYPHIEYIIVDGASKDGTLALVEKYKSVVTRVVSEPDRGIYDAMNKGLALCGGDYVCFLNAGDTFSAPDTLSTAIKAIVNYSTIPDLIYGDTAIVDNEGKFLHLRTHRPPERLTWKSFKWGMLVCHQAFWVKKEKAQTYDLQYRFSADVDWCIRVLKQIDTALFLPYPVINYLHEGATTKNHRASLKERFRIMCKHYGCFSTSLLHLYFFLRVIFRKIK